MRPIPFISTLLTFFFLTAASGVATAQQTCPTDVILALGRSGSACLRMERNQACYGNGAVAASFYTEAPPAFAQPGSIVDARQMQQLQVLPIEEGISAASMLVQATLTDVEERSVAVFLFGEASLTNLVPPTPEVLVAATGRLNIRTTPESDGDIVRQLGIGETLIANGRYTEDDSWLRVRIPNSEDLAWVSTQAALVDGDINQLEAVGIDTPYARPYEIIAIDTGDATFCDGALAAGVLLQTPDAEDGVPLTINDTALAIAGSTFMQTNESDLTVYVLDGWVRVGDADYAPAGTVISVDDGVASPAQPYASETLTALPINNLPYRFAVAAPLPADQIESVIAAIYDEQEVVEVRPTPRPTQPVCRRFVTARTTAWAGPGDFYEAIREIPDSDPVRPVRQYIGEDEVWWQLENSTWIRASRVYQEGECPEIPVIEEVPPQPYNNYSMERCESLNGPLRVGQRVTIQFTPPAFESLAAAQQAQNIDPGRIEVDNRNLRVTATSPVRLGTVGDTDRYVRTFEAIWTAEGGNFRIASDRLSYELVCEVTVPFG